MDPIIPKFQVQFLEEASLFIEGLDEKAREKIFYNIRKAAVTQDQDLFKKLGGEIWEFRTLHKKMKYRLLAFWDKTRGADAVVIVTHGFIKKTDQVPSREIERAVRLHRQYFE